MLNADQAKMPVALAAPAVLLACATFLVGPSKAESLSEAFAAAYRYNPAIDAQRAALRAADEGVAIARSGYRPRVAATGSVAWDRTIPNQGVTAVIGETGQLTEGGVTRSADYRIGLSQTLFSGLQITNRVRAAEARVRAARERLRSAEHRLFIQVVSAYTDVLSAKSLLVLLEAAVRDSNRELRRARERRAAQEITRTDVAQAEAQRAVYLANLTVGKGRLTAARATYVEVVGHEPRRLTQPPLPRGRLPKSLQSAIAVAMREHPLIASALYGEQATRNTVDEVRGRLLPQVDLQASYGQSYTSDRAGTDTTSVSANVRIPIYEGGANHAAVRQAKQLHVGSLQLINVERARVRRAITMAWTRLQVARKRLRYERLRVQANKAAIVGIRKEEAVGQRSLNDLYLAQRALLQAQNDRLAAQREEVVASYLVLAEIGRLEPEQHLPSGELVYDPTVHYDEVHRKWFGLSIVYPNGTREQLDAKMPPPKKARRR